MRDQKDLHRAVQKDQPTFLEQAELDDFAAEQVADLARFAEIKGQHGHAALFWKLARQCRLRAMMLRVQDSIADPISRARDGRTGYG